MIEADGFSTQELPQYSAYRSREEEYEHEAYIVFDGMNGGGYAWDTFMILASKVDGRLFTIEGSGCSCNSLFQDTYSLDGPSGLGEPVTKFEALEQVKEWEGEAESYQDRGGAHADAAGALLRWERVTGL